MQAPGTFPQNFVDRSPSNPNVVVNSNSLRELHNKEQGPTALISLSKCNMLRK